MAPVKRKAQDAVNHRAKKRAASGVNTPVSLASSDSETATPIDEEEDEALQSAVDHFSLSSFRRQRVQGKDAVSHLFKNNHDLSSVPMKPDHHSRPVWIDFETGRVVLESFSPYVGQAQRLLIDIAEPQSRTANIHEYTITPNSLLAAQTVGRDAAGIIHDLEFLSKTYLPNDFKEYVIKAAMSWGQVRLVLKQSKFFIESSDPTVLQRLLKDDVIASCRVEGTEELAVEKAPKLDGLVIPGTKEAAGVRQAQPQKDAQQRQDRQQDSDDEDDEERQRKEEEDMFVTLREEDDDDVSDEVHSFQIRADKVAAVREQSRKLDLPVTEEYDFRNDMMNADLDIDIQPSVQIRDYQEHSLNKMFGNGRCKSGIIVLPCGAGKTLVGITAACTVKKSAIVLCTSAMSVVQWRNEFLKRSNINPDDVAVFTSDKKESFRKDAGVIISTYSMIAQSKQRAHDTKQIMDFIQNKEWGLMILDEVHVVPAEMFRKVTHAIFAHAKLGLTATLLREDDKIQDLNFLIGPKLYEANWLELSEQGHIAKVQCAEVWCPMTTEFYSEYLRTKNTNKRALLFTMNPRKFQACQFLINYHERRGDKVIVFSDNVYALISYARRLGKAMIYGETPQAEREKVLQNFQYNPDVNTIFLSKIGDTSLDLPEATCLIQISSHYGSRRQEAQRLGRILRAKRRNDEGFNAFFYSLVSKDTNEMYYSSKRQAFLVDQGYAFKVITHLHGIESLPDLQLQTGAERREWLQDVMLQNETAGDVEKIEGDLFGERQVRTGGGRGGKGARRMAGTLSELSGGRDMAYIEYNKSKNKEFKKGPQNAFMKKLRRENDKRRSAQKEFVD
ncbi:putative TFIIH complex helicase Ssl2 [Viridothelium virens]|uniref:DNA 3'-5' helicase n=1 Tax=Viridothelium virens TaxID=1048519 RepID=A0A6A6GTE8_VIRVR|nr:putative TFIIH complex helicase Ssl2 [Viridothelium virens]